MCQQGLGEDEIGVVPCDRCYNYTDQAFCYGINRIKNIQLSYPFIYYRLLNLQRSI